MFQDVHKFGEIKALIGNITIYLDCTCQDVLDAGLDINSKSFNYAILDESMIGKFEEEDEYDKKIKFYKMVIMVFFSIVGIKRKMKHEKKFSDFVINHKRTDHQF